MALMAIPVNPKPKDESLALLDCTQTAHGFAVGDLIYRSSSTTWAKARANAVATLATDMVAVVYNANSFRRADQGEEITAGTGLTPQQAIYCSGDTAGAFTTVVGANGAPTGAIAINGVGETVSPTRVIFRSYDAQMV